ncbi:MAG TPA: mannose-6-phosphate isomerase, class I [Candidatus Cloacimonadota bacterium]|nr:mannose-6-phosphate isomerase, class I [Candidatus Cloacimonadota bacterium]
MICRLLNPIKDYAWGSRSYLQELLDMPDKLGSPLAEVWMGAHPESPSRVVTSSGEQDLDLFLASQGDSPLPFLFKVLCADEPLSLQVHPPKALARSGYERENALGLPQDSPRRNYRDANHKPEMLLALTTFEALAGIRDYQEIISTIKLLDLESLPAEFSVFCLEPSPDSLRECFRALLTLAPARRGELINTVLQTLEDRPQFPEEIRSAIRLLNEYYPQDIGSIFPIFINYIKLEHGDAIYLEPGIPHSYLRGSGLELMANSDNVLRGALTPKHIDVEEFLKACELAPRSPLRVQPATEMPGFSCFSPPVDEFVLEIIHAPCPCLELHSCPSIVLCLQGSSTLSEPDSSGALKLNLGETAFIIGAKAIRIDGKCVVALARENRRTKLTNGR